MVDQKPVSLCEGCPLREMYPVADSGLYLSRVGERTIARTWTEDNGTAHLEIDNINGPKEVEVAILSEKDDSGPAFYVSKETWESGRVERSFEACDEPEIVKSGLFKLRKTTICNALKNI